MKEGKKEGGKRKRELRKERDLHFRLSFVILLSLSSPTLTGIELDDKKESWRNQKRYR
jgi:hypothetical protein